jgi:NAD(P)-dependent dehydrogenase (short-subunit alcohol dehydrogenase family)
MRWKDKTVLITGASSGFGRELARVLAGRGARVVVSARRAAALQSLVEELGGEPHRFVPCDVSDLSQVRAMAATLEETAGHLDVLVNNAGVRTAGPLSRASSEAMEQVIRTNLLGPIWCTRELLPLLDAAPRSKRTPLVVNVASMAGRMALPRSGDYTASKFGLVGFTESLWHDLGAAGIRVMMVNPGPAETEGFSMAGLRSRGLGWAVMDPSRVARAAVRGIERGAFEVRVQWWLHPLYYASLLAGPARRFLAAIVGRRIPPGI